MAIEAGWYNDPEYPSQLRWWNGSEWTEHRAPAQAAAPFVAPEPSVAPASYAAPAPFITRAPAVSQQPEPRRKRSRGWLWIVGGVAVAALVIGATFATGHLTFGALPASSSTQAASSGSLGTTPQLSDIAAFGTPAVPTGMTSSDATQNGPPSTAGQVLQDASQGSGVGLSIPACAGLMYQAPITAADVGSSDPVVTFPDYTGTDGTASLVVHGAVRQYSSPAAAARSFSAMSALNQKCAKGYSSADGPVKVLAVSGSWPGTTTVQWDQLLTNRNNTTIEISTFSMLRGSLIVRGTCGYNTKTSALAGQCLSWMSTLDDSIVRAAS